METKNLMIVGVGGQGTLLASRVLGQLFLTEGFDVKVSEVHGMSQRGGSVVTYVRCGDKVFSPLIERGEADFIVAFEALEAARWLPYLREDGQIVMNTQQINPMPVITGAAAYPEDITGQIRGTGARVDALDCLALAREAGSEKAVNMVLLGRLSNYFPYEEQVWLDAFDAVAAEKLWALNHRAFDLGRKYAEK